MHRLHSEAIRAGDPPPPPSPVQEERTPYPRKTTHFEDDKYPDIRLPTSENTHTVGIIAITVASAIAWLILHGKLTH